MQGDLEWDCQWRAVEKALRLLTDVVGISNEITLRAKVMATTCHARFRRRWHARQTRGQARPGRR